MLLQLDNGLFFIPEHEQFEVICNRMARRFASQGINVQDMIATLPEARQ